MPKYEIRCNHINSKGFKCNKMIGYIKTTDPKTSLEFKCSRCKAISKENVK